MKSQLELQMEQEQAAAEESVLRQFVDYEEQGLGVPPPDLQQSYLPVGDAHV